MSIVLLILYNSSFSAASTGVSGYCLLRLGAPGHLTFSLQKQESLSTGRHRGRGRALTSSWGSFSTFQISAHCPRFRAFSPIQSASSDSVRGPGLKGIWKKASKYISGLVTTYCAQISSVQFNIVLQFPKIYVLKLNLFMGCCVCFFSG